MPDPALGVSEEKTTKLGTGRFWVIDVEYRNQKGELVGVESYTGFGYRRMTDRLTIDQVSRAGDELPPLTYDVTATTVVLGALATATGGPCTTTTTSPSTATAPRTSS